MGEVVDLSRKREKGKETDQKDAESDFEKIMEENKKKEEKLRKERLNDNKKVLKSYRIKG